MRRVWVFCRGIGVIMGALRSIDPRPMSDEAAGDRIPGGFVPGAVVGSATTP